MIKKLIFVFFISLLSTSLSAQIIVRKYHTVGIEKNVTITFPNTDNKNKEIFAAIYFGKNSEDHSTKAGYSAYLEKYNANFYLNETTCILWAEYLTKVKSKFIEWSEIAKTNNVKSFSKEFPFKCPIFVNSELRWKRGFESYTSPLRAIKMNFSVNDQGETCIYAEDNNCDKQDNSSSIKWTFVLSNTEELQELIDCLAIQEIKATNNLFQ